MEIMQEIWTREGPHQGMCSCLLEVLCHGNLDHKVVHLVEATWARACVLCDDGEEMKEKTHKMWWTHSQ